MDRYVRIMVDIVEFTSGDVERYADVLSATVARVGDRDLPGAAGELQPIAGELWMGRIKLAGTRGRGAGAAGRRASNDVLRSQVFVRDGFRCTWCGGRAVPRSILVAIHDLFPDVLAYDAHYTRGKIHPVFWALAPEADHLFAHSRGGANELANLTTLHAACNTRKSDSLLADLPTEPHSPAVDDWDGLTSSYPALIAAGAGTVRPEYHRTWSRRYQPTAR